MSTLPARSQPIATRRRLYDIPRFPVLGFDEFRTPVPANVPAVIDERPHILTTSGRAAILQALRALGIGAGDSVMVPTYHCPTMVAPIVHVGARPLFYPIDADGLPTIGRLEELWRPDVKALLAVHWFGLPLDMAPVADWCRSREVALVEDCAHAFFGTRAGAPLGSAGRLCVASLTKFFPVPEGGCLTGEPELLARVMLEPAGFVIQLKRLLDVIESAARYRRLGSLNGFAQGVFSLKTKLRSRRAPPLAPQLPVDQAEQFDESACSRRPAWIAEWVLRRADRAGQIELRRRNYSALAEALGTLRGGRPLRPALPEGAVPYVFPLFVDWPDAVYVQLRAAGIPVFRWDRLWPETPGLPDDVGRIWSHHVLQIACHQSIDERELAWIVDVVREFVDGRKD